MPEPQDPDGNQGDDGSVGNANIRQVRDHAKDLERQLREAKAEAEQAKTAAAEKDSLLANFQKAAVFDALKIPADGPGKLFRDTYQGEITSEAIAAKAAEYNLVQPPSQVPQPTIPGIDQAAWLRQQQALTGTAASTPPNGIERINAAKNLDELNAVLADLGILAE
jgi:hypothetical protein